MPNYIYDDTLLFFPKTDLTPIPSGGDPTQFVQALDWNTLNQAVDDIKGVLRGAEWTGFAPQGADPAPAGVDDYLWFDNADNLFMHVGGGGGSDINLTASGGIVASASNVHVGGVGVFKQLVGSNLEFKGINAGSSKISVVDEVGNNEIDIDVVEANVVHQNLSGAGTKTHAQIDTHVGVFEGVAQGSVWYSTGTVPAALGPGTSGQFLQTSGAGGNPIWANAALIIQDEGSGVTNTPHSTLNFVGPGVVVTDGGGGIALVTVGGGAGNSLNAAYLVNRTITATSDAVQILGTSDNTDHTLEVTKVPGSARDGHAIAVTMGSQATDYGINIGYTQISVAADGRGLRLINTTIAAAGNQQNSPVVAWVGQGWKTDATAETQEVLFAQQVVPIEGTAAPTGELRWYSAINGGAFTEIMTVNSAGTSFTAAGMTISNDGTITTLLGTAGDYIRIGDASTTSHGYDSEDDLLVTGRLEVDGLSWFDSLVIINKDITFTVNGTGYGTLASQADHGLVLSVIGTDGQANHNFILISKDNQGDNYGHNPASVDPTFIIHSETAAATATDQFLRFTHDKTSGIITAGVGGVSIEGLNISNDGTITTLLGTAGDYLRIGDANTTSHGLNSEDDLLVTGEIEVDGPAFFDDAIQSNYAGSVAALSITSTSTGFGIDLVSVSAKQIRVSQTTADAASKQFYMQTRHYLNAEKDFGLFVAIASSGTNTLNIGGGTSLLNSAGVVLIFTAANTTTVNGTEAIRWDGSQRTIFAAQMRGPDGSIGVPSYAFGSDIDTGATLIGSDAYGIVTGGRLGLGIANDATLTRLTTTAGDYFVFGSGTTSHGFNSEDDLLITGRLEVNGAAFFDTSVNIFGDDGGDAINIVLGDAAFTGQALVVTEDNVARSTPMVQLTRQASALGTCITIDNNGGQSAINISQGGGSHAITLRIDGAGFTGQAIVVTESAVARTKPMMTMTRDAAVVDPSAHALSIVNAGTTNSALNILQSGGGFAIRISLATSTTAQGIRITEDDLVRTSVMLEMTRQPLATHHVLSIDNNGLANAIFIMQGGAAAAVDITIDGAGFLGKAIVVTETAVARTTTMMSLTRDAAVVDAGAHVLQINNAGAGRSIDVTSGDVFIQDSLTVGSTATLAGLVISNDGTKTTLLGTPGDYLRIGDAALSTVGLNSNNDLLVTGGLEVVSNSAFLENVNFESGFIVAAGSTTYGRFRAISDEGLHLAITATDGQANHNFILVSQPSIFDDYDHQPASVNPTFIVHSATAAATATDQWLSFTHNQTSGIIVSGTGGTSIEGLNISNDGTITTLLGTAGDYMRIGDAAVTSRSLNSEDDLLVTGELEVDGTLYLDGLVKLTNSSADIAFQITNNGTNTGLFISNTGNGMGLDVNYGGNTQAVRFHILGASTSGRALIINESAVARTTPMMTMTRDALATATGHVLQIINAGSGRSIDVVSGDVFIQDSLTVSGTATLAGLNISNNGTITTLLSTPGDYLRIGDFTVTTNGFLLGENDLLVSGRFEVFGFASFVNGCFWQTAGEGDYGNMRASVDDGLHLGITSGDGAANHNFILVSIAHVGLDYGHNSSTTNPTFIIHSAVAPANGGTTRFGATWHDEDNFRTTSGRGGHSFELLAQHAEGTLTLTGQPSNNESFVVNATTITAKTSGAGANEFNIGASVADTIANMVATINADAESGNARAWVGAGTSVVVEWLTAGTAGNSITFTTALSNSSIDGGGTLGGTHAGIAAYTALAIDSALHTFKHATGDLLTLGNTNAVFNLQVLPLLDNSRSLGLVNFRWSNFFTTLATIAGLSFSNDGTITTLLGEAGDYLRIGDAATTGFQASLDSNDDLLVTGKIEVAGSSIFRNRTVWATGSGITLYMETATVTDDGLHFGISDQDGQVNHNLILVSVANIANDYDHQPASADPTFIIHSATAAGTATNQFLRLTHNQTSGIITAGTGGVSIEGLNISNDGTKTTLLGTSGDYLRIGDANTTSRSLNTNDDLLITGKLEVDGVLYLDGSIRLLDNVELQFGTGTADDGRMLHSTVQSTDSLMLVMGSDSNSLIFCGRDDLSVNFVHSIAPHPTQFFQNDDGKSIYGFGGIWHDNDAFTFTSGRGGHSFELDAQYAQGTLTLTGQPSNNQTFVINNTTCTAKTSGAGTDEFDIGGNVAATIVNIVAMILAGTESGNAKAWAGAGTTVVCEWKTAGTAGNAITFTESLSNATIDGGGTLGGTHAGIAAITPLTLSADALTVGDTINFVFNTGTGTKLGTGITQKMAFWNATPVVQPGHIADPAGGGTIDAEARTAINAILADLAELGLQASA